MAEMTKINQKEPHICKTNQIFEKIMVKNSDIYWLIAWVVLLQVVSHDWKRLDSWYFGPLDILALQGKIQGKKIVKHFWPITFDWSVLQT